MHYFGAVKKPENPDSRNAIRERKRQAGDSICLCHTKPVKNFPLRLIWLTITCPVAFAQSPMEACKAELQHLTVPTYAQIDDGNSKTPVEFLFTDGGKDFYSAIPSYEPNFLSWIKRSGVRVIVVYQDETVRRSEIQNLSKPGDVATIMAGSSPHGSLKNLKFAVLHLVPWRLSEQKVDLHQNIQERLYQDLITTEWKIEGVNYFEPQTCETPSHTDLCVTATGRAVPCVMSGLHASSNKPNWITEKNMGLPGASKPLMPYDDPVFVRITEEIRERLKRLNPANT